MEADWQERAGQAVTALRAHGAARGDRIALVCGNDPTVLALTWGALRAGIIPVPINTALTDAQVHDQVADARPRLVVADEVSAGRVEGDLVIDDRVLSGLRPAADLHRVPLGRPMHFTSGTSGRPKGVWTGVLGPALGDAWASEEAAANPSGPGDVHLVCAPLFHSGPHRYALNALNTGSDVVITRGFDAGEVLATIASARVTTAFMVPTHLARLLDHPSFATTDLSSLRWVHHAGAACPEPLKRRALDALPHGVLHEFYGSTEGQFTAISPVEWLARPGSVGRPRPGRTLRITDEAGQAVPAGTTGQVWVSAPPHARFSYLGAPEATRAAWDGDHFTVGDLGHVDDDGWLTLAGRRTDLIVTGGVNVYPAEVERVLLAHPGVLEGVVYGTPDPEWGQQVTAAVVPRRGVHLDAEEVRGFLRARLAGFQTPKAVHVVADLPRTASGKVVRARLSDPRGGW